jgi:phosphatidate cytidylyltransferase
MAFNWQTFRIRTISSLVFMAVMLSGILWNKWSFLFLFSIIHFGCWWEYLSLTAKIRRTNIHPYIKLGFMVLGYGLVLLFCRPFYQVNTYGLKQNLAVPLSAAGFAMLILGIFQKTTISLKTFGMAALGLLYISFSIGCMINLYNPIKLLNQEPALILASYTVPLFIIVSLWINDTMAYLVGSLIGKTPFSKISPKKTWEGTIGGMILCIILIGILLPLILIPFANRSFYTYLAVISGIAAVTGTAGDLFESKLKRMANVKDSGNLMPGHGGFLDRFDSLLFAIPCTWIFNWIFFQLGAAF